MFCLISLVESFILKTVWIFWIISYRLEYLYADFYFFMLLVKYKLIKEFI